MSSDLQTTVAAIKLNDYLSAALITIVGYDYILTFAQEIEYIWSRSWTWVSTMFVFARYFGCLYTITSALLGSTFVSGPVEVGVLSSYNVLNDENMRYRGNVLNLLGNWSFPPFLGAADFVMILRVYAMYNQSRIVLGILVVMFTGTIVFIVVLSAIYTNPTTSSVTVPNLLNFSYCAVTYIWDPNLPTYAIIPRLILSAVTCTFAVVRFTKQSLQMYKATKLWQPNRYMNLFVKEGILYFAINLLNSIVLLVQAGPLGSYIAGIPNMVLSVLAYGLLCVLAPRFIMNVRVLYVRDLGDHRRGIDTGFGMFSGQEEGMPKNTSTAILFADATRTEDIEEREEVSTAVERPTDIARGHWGDQHPEGVSSSGR